MNVLIVHNTYQQRGGEDVVVDAQELALKRAGVDVWRWGRHSADIDGWSPARKARVPLDAIFSVQTYREIRRLVRCKGISVAHVHNVFPLISPSVYRALADSGVAIVQTIHNYRLMCPNGLLFTHGRICERCMDGRLWHAITGRCLRDSAAASAMYAASIGLHRALGTFGLIDCFVALSPFVRQKVLQAHMAPADRVRTLGNFLPNPLPEPKSGPGPRPVFLFLGRLSSEKGLETLFDAGGLVPDARVTVAGDGPMRNALEGRLSDTGVHNVRMIGYLTGEAKSRLLLDSTALVVPSLWYEPFGRVVLEAYATGTPVIASDQGGLADIVQDGMTGLLFRPGDSKDLARKMEQMANNQEAAFEMGQRGRELLLQSYTEQAHVQKLLSIYEEAILC